MTTTNETTNETAVSTTKTGIDYKNPVAVFEYALAHNLLDATQAIMYSAVKDVAGMTLESIAPAFVTKDLLERVKAHVKDASSVDHVALFMEHGDVKEHMTLVLGHLKALNELVYAYNDANDGANLTPAILTQVSSKNRQRTKKDRPTYTDLAKDVIGVDKEAKLIWRYNEHTYLDSTIKASTESEVNNGIKQDVTRYRIYWNGQNGEGKWVEIGMLPSLCRAAVSYGKPKPSDINVWDHVDLLYNDGTQDKAKRMSLDSFVNRSSQAQ